MIKKITKKTFDTLQFQKEGYSSISGDALKSPQCSITYNFYGIKITVTLVP